MNTTLRICLPVVSLLVALATAPPGQAAEPTEPAKAAEQAKPASDTLSAPETKPAPESKAAELKAIRDEDNGCILCHRELTEKDQQRFLVTPEDLAKDIHWRMGIRCQDCHGGDPTQLEIKAHFGTGEFRAVKSPAEIPEFCGRCHSDIAYMRRYVPSPRTDQLSEYWTSGHGQKLKQGDTQVATCISCHDKPHGSAQDTLKHSIRRVDDLESPVYHTRLAKTCAHCHGDEKLMAGREYHGRPLGTAQYGEWRQSVHAAALLKKGDLSAPSCNNCHGNHGALPPSVDSVANACGSCHTKTAQLFANTRMKHRFEEVGLPGCATCHNEHLIRLPSDELLGMTANAVCARCHEKGRYGATLAGKEAAQQMRTRLEELKRHIAGAQQTIATADALGMEVRGPRFDLRKAADALTNARVLVHGFSIEPVKKQLDVGLQVAAEVQQLADKALEEHHQRRVWLAASLLPIVVVIGVLVLYIRSLPPK